MQWAAGWRAREPGRPGLTSNGAFDGQCGVEVGQEGATIGEFLGPEPEVGWVQAGWAPTVPAQKSPAGGGNALLERADLAPKMVSLIERYQRNPTVNAADSLAQAMEVPLWRLIKDAEDLRKEKALSKAREVRRDFCSPRAAFFS